MKTSPRRTLSCILAYLGVFVLPVAAENAFTSTSLKSCQDNSEFTAKLFSVVYTPDTGVANVNLSAISTIEASVLFDIEIIVYGYSFLHIVVNPCEIGLAGFCPMYSAELDNPPFTVPISKSAAQDIPSIAYNFPDLDAKVRVYINATDGNRAGQSVACVEAQVSNGKTVDLIGVKWAAAVVAGLALTSSAIISGLGHSNAASHVAANALSLCSYFQAQAMVGLVGIPLPPVVQAWTQDFQWSMGIINVGFMQTIFTWYQRATGGTPSTLFNIDTVFSTSVEIQKRSLPMAGPLLDLAGRAAEMIPHTVSDSASGIVKRGNIKTEYGSWLVYGIQRVAYRAGIESTNLFLTGITFFYLVLVFTTLAVAAFKGLCEVAARAKWIKGGTFLEFRNGWHTVLKGILFRMILLGYPPVTILCFWEFTQNDSPAEMVLAVFFLLFVHIALLWGAYKVIRIARRSVALHRNPAYILFSDPQTLNKWGFLYIQYRASAYYFVVPLLGYVFLKALFISFAQNSGVVQAISLILIEAGWLIAATVLRPWMDKKTNGFNITIAAVNFVNAILLLMFTNVFDQPALATGILGLFLWILNAVCTLVLLIMLIVTTIIVIFTDNPDGRYKFMADDRTSFMKSQSQLATTTELDALAITARGEKGGVGGSALDLDDDDESIPSLRQRPMSVNHALHPSATGSVSSFGAPGSRPRTSVDRSMPFLPVAANRRLSRSVSPGVNGGSRSSMTNPTAYRSLQNTSPGPTTPNGAR
ncbi:calcium-related spray protein [Xylariomycetidae sp. FL2044]|nr:calcium-related spray protein [Xylariomycetidae sp. FL2044]